VKTILKYTSIHIPGLPGWRPLYINQACDIFILTKRDLQMNMKISDFIADPTLVSRVMITGIASGEVDMMYDFSQFSGLEEAAIADRGV
jgi:hypothetical protein